MSVQEQAAGCIRVRLHDGRDLAYEQYGEASGFPVFYFHGTPSSRLEGRLAHAAARHHGFRLLAIDRPGFGRSSFQPGRRFLDWPSDIVELADHLELREFGLAGHSGAGPHLFACGASISPDRVRFIGALGPWGPIDDPAVARELNPLDRFYAALARRVPGLLHLAFAPFGWTARWAPGLFLELLRAAVPAADQAVLNDQAKRDAFRHMLTEAFRQGSRGAAHEARIAYSPWGVDLETVAAPTFIWLGEQDLFVSRTMGAALAAALPACELHIVPEKGHLNVENWDDIFRACRAHLESQ